MFCHTTLLEPTDASLPGVGVKPTKVLPDGIYCIHTGEFAKGRPAPAFAAPFVIGGLAEMTVAETKVSIENGKARLTMVLKNAGEGEFNDGTFMMTLQRINPEKGKSAFSGRWNDRLPKVAAKGTGTYEKEVPTSAWVPGPYYFSGHISVMGSNDDSDYLERFKSEQFVIPKAD